MGQHRHEYGGGARQPKPKTRPREGQVGLMVSAQRVLLRWQIFMLPLFLETHIQNRPRLKRKYSNLSSAKSILDSDNRFDFHN